MFVPAPNKNNNTNLRLSRAQAFAILAFKEFLATSKIQMETHPAVVFMDITAQLDKQLQ